MRSINVKFTLNSKIYALVVLAFLFSSCNHSKYTLGMTTDQEVEAKDAQTSKPGSVEEKNNVVCPICKQNNRFFCKCSHGDIFLFCSECDLAWRINPQETVSARSLELEGCLDGSDDWATEQEVVEKGFGEHIGNNALINEHGSDTETEEEL